MMGNGYESILLTLSKNCGFAVPNFPSMIFNKKIADTTYCGPPFFHVSRYHDISQSKKMNLGAMLIPIRFDLQIITITCHYHNLLKMLDFKWIS